MSHLAIYLLGGFQVELGGSPKTQWKTDKNRALLAYLALESDRPHRRDSLANLLWCQHEQAGALHNLRQALYFLRNFLQQDLASEPYLIIEPNQVQFNLASNHWIDVREFQSCLFDCELHHPAGQSLCTDCMLLLEKAIELYRDDFLKGFTLRDCEEFTDWQVSIQEDSLYQMMKALILQAEDLEHSLAYDRLIVCARRMIELEPWHEFAYQRLMWGMANIGQREMALRQYETLSKILRRDLGTTPLEETRRLFEQILAESERDSAHPADWLLARD